MRTLISILIIAIVATLCILSDDRTPKCEILQMLFYLSLLIIFKAQNHSKTHHFSSEMRTIR